MNPTTTTVTPTTVTGATYSPTYDVLRDGFAVGVVQFRDDYVNGPRWVAFDARGIIHLGTFTTRDEAVAAVEAATN